MPPDRLLLARALLDVSSMALRLRVLGFSRSCAGLLDPVEGSPSRQDTAAIPRILKAYTRTSRLPWSTCLTRSAAAVRYLRAAGVPAQLAIGARNEPAFAAHAWVAVNGLGEVPDGDGYSALNGLGSGS